MKFITCWSCGAAIWLHAPTCTHFSFFNYLGIFYSVRVTFWILSSPISQVANYALAHLRLALISRIQMSALLAKGQKKKKKKKRKSTASHLYVSFLPQIISCPSPFNGEECFGRGNIKMALKDPQPLVQRDGDKETSVRFLTPSSLFSLLATHSHLSSWFYLFFSTLPTNETN